jgi:hypothetical protein
MLAPRTSLSLSLPSRRLLLSAPALALLLTVAGCEKPTPGVTVVADGKSVHGEATQYCRGGANLVQGNECPGTSDGTLVLEVRQGDDVAIDVDKEVSDSGWYVVDTDARTRYSYQSSHFTSFQADFSNRPVAGIINLSVLQVKSIPAKDSDVAPVIGQWKITLRQKG